MKIHEKLLYVQRSLKAPKNQYNEFGNFHYRSCEDILEGVKPLLAEVKAVLLIGDEVVQIGNRFYVKATAVFQDTESPDLVKNTAFAREDDGKAKMDGAQTTGSCSSYARKYALNGLFCIDDSKDPDFSQGNPAAGNKGKESNGSRVQTGRKESGTSVRKPQVSKADLEKLISEAQRTGTDLSMVCERYQVKHINHLSKEQYEKAMRVFGRMESFPPPAPEQRYDETKWNAEEAPFR